MHAPVCGRTLRQAQRESGFALLKRHWPVRRGTFSTAKVDELLRAICTVYSGVVFIYPRERDGLPMLSEGHMNREMSSTA